MAGLGARLEPDDGTPEGITPADLTTGAPCVGEPGDGAAGGRMGSTTGALAASGAPHMPQNRLPSLFSLPQRPQRTRPLL